MASWTGLFKNESGFFKEFSLKNPVNPTHIIQELTDLYGWTVLIKIEILIMAGLIFLAGQCGQMESALVLVRRQALTFLEVWICHCTLAHFGGTSFLLFLNGWSTCSRFPLGLLSFTKELVIWIIQGGVAAISGAVCIFFQCWFISLVQGKNNNRSMDSVGPEGWLDWQKTSPAGCVVSFFKQTVKSSPVNLRFCLFVKVRSHSQN